MKSLSLLLLLLQGISLVSGWVLAPELPQKYNPKNYKPLFKEINMCAYKNVKTDGGGNVSAWICGPVDEQYG